MLVEKHCDWISFTISHTLTPDGLTAFCEWKPDGKGKHGYALLYRCETCGATVETGGYNIEMGHHFTYSGKSLERFRGQSGQPETIVQALCKTIVLFGGHCARLDLAMTVIGGKETPASCYRAFKRGQMKTSARTGRYINGVGEGNNVGDTLYIGAPTSQKQLRIYDKRAELGYDKDSPTRTRFELQLRDELATNAMRAIAEHGEEEVTTGMLSEFVKWDNPEFTRSLSGAGIQPEAVGRKSTDTERWLLATVAPILAKVARSNTGFLDTFIEVVKLIMADG